MTLQMSQAELDRQPAGSVRIVTAAQITEGFVEKRGMFLERRRYQILRDLGDGRFAVREPGWQT